MNYKKLDQEFYYEGTDLGSRYTKEATSFRVWAPTAQKVELKLFKEGLGDCQIAAYPMELSQKGTWFCKVCKDLKNVYYTYDITIDDVTNETVDIYAKATGANGKRGMIIDLESTNPEGWEQDKKPELKKMTDSIIYELHVRDLSVDENSGIENKGKYLGLVEMGTKSSEGLSTGLDHMKELGITHVHLLPIHDYCSVDEEHLEKPQFNWGYDPMNYNVPEGSYATDPFHGEVRIKEYKQAIQEFHRNGIRVVMDVVYNHTFANVDSYFNKTVPGYYYRMKNGKFTDGSGCGNETASDHKMMRKFMVESLCYWAKEYHIDGFRFDLMAVHDIQTMNEIKEALNTIDPTIIVYGEGWTGGPSLLPEKLSAKKIYAKKMPEIAMFNDDIRDSIKGHVFDEEKQGFVNGGKDFEEAIAFSVTGAVGHSKVKFVHPWAGTTAQSINYVSAHDNLTLWDKLAIANAEDSEEVRKRMNCLSAAIVFTAQGIPFFQAGEELLRTKPSIREGRTYENDSYNSPDSVNAIRWKWKSEHKDVFKYYKGLIAFRKAHQAFHMLNKDEIERQITFLRKDENVVMYTMKESQPKEAEILVIYNSNREAVTLNIPKGNWSVYVKDRKAGCDVLEVIKGDSVKVESISALVAVREF